MSDGGALILSLVLLAANAFFVGAEFALVSVRRSQIEPLVEAGSRRARSTMWAIRRVTLMMAGAQLGITLSTVGLGAVAEPALAHLIQPAFETVGVPHALLHPVAIVIALLVVVALHVVLGEMVPKNIALAAPDRAALALGPPLRAMVRAIRPVITGLNGAANGVLWLLRVTPQDEVDDAVTHEEVGHLLAESRNEGLVDEDEHRLTTEALAFAEGTAGDVAIPLDSVVLIDARATAADVEELSARTGHSRFPRRDSEGLLSGYVHLKDVLADTADERPRPLVPDRIRRLPAITTATPLVEVLAALRLGASHLARVDDESGTTTGVLTLDDVLLRLVPPRQHQEAR
ncbi:Hemolysin, contains CBS domains [Actinopolymorpha cephalotaxi]|uniref:CBS domain containing-hemolysin-like protein n=1 Tax=Actinopolymorpha cephalotaxi TaxID=504797 RepID=A0A1I2NMW7_9ACTN|nr:hemolysin family protein [Actinopolymorpha cephalotaxi]NYH85530.1 CBS domain containing-hemolysin-like protein [Actinopolymorpha cephalotaxi]SFG02806.1 Hemolysin, contains CBS domains [Actinopolymorpha cephalotaxi]